MKKRDLYWLWMGEFLKARWWLFFLLSLGVCFFLSLLVFLIGWGDQRRLLEETTYFAIDWLVLSLAILLGAQETGRHSCKNGLFDFLLPLGFSPLGLMGVEFLSLASLLFCVSGFLVGLRFLTLEFFLADQSLSSLFFFLVFVWGHGLLGLALSLFFALFFSFSFSVLMSFFVLFFGHGFSALANVLKLNPDDGSPMALALVQWVSRLWNPNLWVLSWQSHAWSFPTWPRLGVHVLWLLSALGFLFALLNLIFFLKGWGKRPFWERLDSKEGL